MNCMHKLMKNILNLNSRCCNDDENYYKKISKIFDAKNFTFENYPFQNTKHYLQNIYSYFFSSSQCTSQATS